MNNKDNIHSFDSNAGILPIGAVAQSLGIHQRTLRIYDTEGILTPKRSDGDRRLYSFNDVEKAKFILFLTRNLALNLSGVKIIIAMLEKTNIKPKDYQSYVEKIAKLAKIDTDIQKVNIEKTSKRGRKVSK